MEEFDRMYSSDKTVRLTNKRIIVDNGERQQEIQLEDYTGYSIKKQNIGNYGILVNLFGLLILLSFLGIVNDSFPSFKGITRMFSKNIFLASFYTIPFLICMVLFLVSLFYYLLGKRHFLEIKGKYNSISIHLKNTKSKSLRKFLSLLDEERNKFNADL